MKQIVRHSVVVFCSIFIIMLSSCSPQATKDSAGNTENSGTSLQNEHSAQKNSNHTLYILLGNGFNSAEFSAPLLIDIEKDFGMAENGGFVQILTYPNDFMVGNTARISKLSAITEDPKLAFLLTVGAPEATSRPLSEIRQKRGDVCVVSLFPQDDITAIQGQSTIVLDFDTHVYAEGDTIEARNTDVQKLISSLIAYAHSYEQKNAVVPKGKELLAELQALFLPEWKTSFFLDPETGIRAINHFTLLQNADIIK